MKVFKLLLSEKRNGYCSDGIYKRIIKAKNRNLAYDKSLKIISNFPYFNKCDKDMIFWFDNRQIALWINGIEEIKEYDSILTI